MTAKIAVKLSYEKEELSLYDEHLAIVVHRDLRQQYFLEKPNEN